MTVDLIIKNASVIDGTGAPATTADVAVEGGVIVAVGAVDHDAREVVDGSGHVLTPGFIDIHTHYDAQVFWDPDLTPSSWHGVTTVVMGNCGFGIAPTRPQHRESIARTLENVEGMSVDALIAGIPWNFETFPQYLDIVEAILTRLDVAVFVGHTPVRLYVLGPEATERAATDDEVAEMVRIVGEAMDAGAIGFATSKAAGHTGDGGKPVPSRLAEYAEISAIAGALGERGRGVIEVTTGPGLFVDELAEISTKNGVNVTWAALVTGLASKGTAPKILDKTEAAGGRVWPQVACRPIVMQITMQDPFPFSKVAGFDRVLSAPRSERATIYADRVWRDSVREGIAQAWGHQWPKTNIAESVVHADLIDGPTVAELAADRGVDAFDLICDLSLEDDLRTRFRIVLVNDDEEELQILLNDDRSILGLSDAGAHVSQLCDAGFSTTPAGPLGARPRCVAAREGGVAPDGPAGRGVLAARSWSHRSGQEGRPGAVRSRHGRGRTARASVLPAGADRLISRSTGIRDVGVSGQPIRRDGEDVDGARPGRLLRTR